MMSKAFALTTALMLFLLCGTLRAQNPAPAAVPATADS